MAKPHKTEASLAQFVSNTREKIGFSQSGLAQRCNLTVEEIENIENGSELFLSSTVRQKLAKGLKVGLDEIKLYEKIEQFSLTPESIIDEIKDEILAGKEILCPRCNSPLITRIAKLYDVTSELNKNEVFNSRASESKGLRPYDLEDNLVLHPKARCSKCPFQIV